MAKTKTKSTKGKTAKQNGAPIDKGDVRFQSDDKAVMNTSLLKLRYVLANEPAQACIDWYRSVQVVSAVTTRASREEKSPSKSARSKTPPRPAPEMPVHTLLQPAFTLRVHVAQVLFFPVHRVDVARPYAYLCILFGSFFVPDHMITSDVIMCVCILFGSFFVPHEPVSWGSCVFVLQVVLPTKREHYHFMEDQEDDHGLIRDVVAERSLPLEASFKDHDGQFNPAYPVFPRTHATCYLCTHACTTTTPHMPFSCRSPSCRSSSKA